MTILRKLHSEWVNKGMQIFFLCASTISTCQHFNTYGQTSIKTFCFVERSFCTIYNLQFQVSFFKSRGISTGLLLQVGWHFF